MNSDYWKRPFFSALVIVIFFFTHAIAGAQANSSIPRTPHQIIDSFARQIQRIGASSPSSNGFGRAESAARDELKQLVSRDPFANELVRKTPAGMTPLMLAAYYGFPEFARELLMSPRVKDSINEEGQNRATAWMLAIYGLQLNRWSCDPTVLNDPFMWVPLFESLAYYQSRHGQNSYELTRVILEEAGAEPNLDGAKAAWNRVCPRSDQDLQERIRIGTDLPKVLREDSQTRFIKFSQQLEQKQAHRIESTPAEITLPKKFNTDGFKLPNDISVKPPGDKLGAAVSKLSGWWVGQNFLLPVRMLLIFEEFKSDGECVLLFATSENGNRPSIWRRVAVKLDSDAPTFQVTSTINISIRSVQRDTLIADVAVDQGRGTLHMEFERVIP